MDIIYATFAVVRLFVYVTFFIKTKTVLQYYYIWVAGLVAFTHDYFLLSEENSPCTNHFLYIKMFLSWFAVIAYWRNLDSRNTSIFRVARMIVGYCKPLAISIVVFIILHLVTDNATDDPTFFYSIVLSLCTASGLIFLGIVWKSSHWKQQPSFLMFGCIFMLVPVHTILQVIAEYLNGNQLLSTLYAQKILTVVLFTTAQCEGIIPFRVLTSTLLEQIDWPDLKGEALRLMLYNDEKIIPRHHQPAITITSKVDETKTCVLKY